MTFKSHVLIKTTTSAKVPGPTYQDMSGRVHGHDIPERDHIFAYPDLQVPAGPPLRELQNAWPFGIPGHAHAAMLPLLSKFGTC